MAAGTLREVPPYVFISMFVDVLITTAGVERVKSPLYGADFSDPAVLGTLIDHLVDMLLAATCRHLSTTGDPPGRSDAFTGRDWRARIARREEAVKPSPRLTSLVPQPRHKSIKRA
jgi:hypothetical protein